MAISDQELRDEWIKQTGRSGNNSLLDMFVSVPLSDRNQQAAPNKFSMPNVSNLTSYIPSMSSLSGFIPKEIPNVFGQRNPAYESLLGVPQSQALSRQSNIAGLLGAAAAIAQGMGSQGPRRSATQNILSALGTGYGAAGQAYQGGIEQMVNAQKLAQMKLQMQQNTATQSAITNMLSDPAIANDPLAIAYIRSNPADAIKEYAQQKAFQRERDSIRSSMFGAPPAPVQGGQVEGAALPTQGAQGNSEIAMLERQIQNAMADAAAYAARRDPAKQKLALDSVKEFRERQANLLVGEIDIRDRIKNAPPGYVQQYKTIADAKEAGVLKGKELLDSIQKVDQSVIESNKQYRYDGNTGQYAYLKYGTNDATKLSPDQNKDVLAYSNAPNQADLLSNVISAKRLEAERGIKIPMPESREQKTNLQVAVQPTTAAAVQGQTAPRIRGAYEPMENAPTPIVDPNLQRTGEAPVVSPPVVQSVQPPVVAPTIRQPQVQPQAAPPVIRQTQPVAPNVQPQAQPAQAQPAPPKAKPLVDIGKTVPLIKQPDIKVPLATKQKLLEQQNGATSATSYALTNIKDARDVAKNLLDNPRYIKALSGPFAPRLSEAPIGDAYNAKQILDNLLGRSFITEIAEMRANSPTGGAVGNVAVAEMEALSKIRGALKVGMSEKELRNQLQTYINNSDRALRGIPKRYAEIYGYDGQFDDILTGTVIPQGNNQPVDPVTQELQRRKQAAKKGNKP